MAFCIDQGLKYAIFGSKQAKNPYLTLKIAEIRKKIYFKAENSII